MLTVSPHLTKLNLSFEIAGYVDVDPVKFRRNQLVVELAKRFERARGFRYVSKFTPR